jgi:regulation of enolase protein 1 (concanavalin A-like superfamily)
MLASTIIAAAALSFQGASEDTTPWKTFIVKDGQFIVDFPTNPTNTANETINGPGGRMKVVTVACDTPPVAFIAQKFVLRTAVVKGAEQTLLEAYRDFFAKQYKGKVISEKKVRFEGKHGLDYTIRGKLAGNAISTIRVRQYLAGPAIYILQAVSAPNRELPDDDVSRFFGSFTIGTTPRKKSRAQADVAGKELPGWGTAIDPDGDCTISPDGKALAITIPGALHDLNADIDKFNAPRVLRQVDGDFDMTVKVVGDFQPGPKSLNPKSVPFNGAGLFVWRDSDNYIRLERAAIIRQRKLSTFAEFEEREGGSTGAMHNGKLTPGTTYLRLARKGSRIFGFTSKDGKSWTQLRPMDTKWPADLKVGVDAINSSNEPFSVRFEEFTFKGNSSARP